MRQLKFRGKDVKTGEWLYGDLVHSADGKRCAILVSGRDSYDECEVNPETVDQFTGLRDKNGKEIYEGDILRLGDSDSGVCEVGWNDTIGAFCIRFHFESELGSKPLGSWKDFERNMVVIGNIHDNSELLKGGNP